MAVLTGNMMTNHWNVGYPSFRQIYMNAVPKLAFLLGSEIILFREKSCGSNCGFEPRKNAISLYIYTYTDEIRMKYEGLQMIPVASGNL